MLGSLVPGCALLSLVLLSSVLSRFLGPAQGVRGLRTKYPEGLRRRNVG